MALISLAQGLAHAQQHGYALGAFNVLDTHFLRALFHAAEQRVRRLSSTLPRCILNTSARTADRRYPCRSGAAPSRWCSTSIMACILMR